MKFNQSTLTKCKCCNSTIEVMTIYDMLEKAYSILENDPMIQNLITLLQVNISDLQIAQNRFRKKFMLDDIDAAFGEYDDQYEIVSNDGTIPLIVCFDESFSIIEEIGFDYELLSALHISKKEDIEKQSFLNKILETIHSSYNNIQDYFIIQDGKIVHNEKYSNHENLDEEIEYLYLRYHEDDTSYTRCVFHLRYNEDYYRTNKNYSLWLNQEIISMFPDFGKVYLWHNGGGDIEDMFTDQYNIPQTLINDFYAWAKYFDENAPYATEIYIDNKMDWNLFNTLGKRLWQDLQQIVKDKYIITYGISFEEQESKKVAN